MATSMASRSRKSLYAHREPSVSLAQTQTSVECAYSSSAWGEMIIAPVQAQGLVPDIAMTVTAIPPAVNAAHEFDEAVSFVGQGEKLWVVQANLANLNGEGIIFMGRRTFAAVRHRITRRASTSRRLSP